MAKDYLDKLTKIMQQALARRFKHVNIEYKHFFSGAAVYANGRICISLTPVGFAIKLPSKSRDLLLKEKGTNYLRYFAEGPVKKDYVVLPEAMVNDVKILRKWVKITIEYVLTLPKPNKK